MKPTTSEVRNIDCMEFMRGLPDKFFDLVVADPPYGLGKKIHDGGTWAEKYKRSPLQGGRPFSKSNGHLWDTAPTKEWFDELFRVSKSQIIWGANHFEMPRTECFLVWDKMQPDGCSFAQVEYAWTSFDSRPKIYQEAPQRGNGRFHPTQKPIALYAWLLEKYAKPGDKIFDPMLGSGSSRIAAYKLGFDFWGCELDHEYFEKAEKRFRESIAMPLFDDPNANQIAMFEQ
jgi:site-specific DNA-methyltransferase (adenine-specific)